MGRTFQARDRRLGREVVIKQPLASDQGFDLRTRFEREALLTARLQHPSIVGIYEAGRFPDGEPFFAMPLVRGAPLSDEIARRTTLEQRIALLGNVTAVCEAVAYAHDQGIVHRDIKPANILVGSFGETVLIDWGLATGMKSAAALVDASGTDIGDGLTQFGVGTAQYMPPEQARGGAPDARMDVYALGATLYHALAGTPPYGSMESGDVRSRLLAEPPLPLSTVAPHVPPALSDIVARAMSRDPAQRFETASALAAELRRFQTGQLVQSRRYGAGEILRHFARRYRAPLIVAGVAAMVVTVAAVVSAVRIANAGRNAAVAQRHAEENERKSKRELQRGLGVSASRLALDPTRRLDALELAVDAVAPEVAAGRAPAREALQGLYDAIAAGPPVVVLDANTTVIRRFVFSSDGTLLATVSPGEHAVHIWDARSGRLLGAAAAGGAHFSVRDLHFSPDSAWLLTWGQDPPQVQLWPVIEGRAITLSLRGAIAGADFLPSGEIVVAGSGVTFFGRDGVELRGAALPAPATTLTVTGDRIVVSTTRGDVIELDSSGKTIAVTRTPPVSNEAPTWTARPGRLEQLDHDVLAPIRAVEGPPGLAIEALAVAPDKRVAVATERTSWLVDARSDGFLLGHTSEVSAIGNVGQMIVSSGLDGRLLGWDTQGNRTETIALGSEALVMVTAGTAIIVGDADGKLVVIDGKERSRIDPDPDPRASGALVSAIRTSPDGHCVVVARADGGLFWADVRSQPPRSSAHWLARGAPVATAVAFSEDGSHVATGHADGTIRLWHRGSADSIGCAPPTLVATTSIPDRDNAGRARYTLAFDRNGRLLASRFGFDTAVFSVPGLAKQDALEGRLLAVSRDGRRIATLASDHEVVLFVDTAQDRPMRMAASRRPIVASAFSPDGSMLIMGDVDGSIRTIDIAKVIAGADATVEISAAGAGAVSALDFSRDGKLVLVGHVSGALRTHPLDAKDALRRACRTLVDFGRDLPSCATSK